MAKRTLLGHTKLKKICRRLDIPTYAGVGLLECLWHLTVREAPRGDIGKLSDEDIAIAIDWRGDESSLIEALVSSGLLDRNAEHRLVVHDWAEHAEDSVHMSLARAVQLFADGTKPKTNRLSSAEREKIEAEFRVQCAHTSKDDAHGKRTACALPSPPIPSHPLAKPKPSPPEVSNNSKRATKRGKPGILTSSLGGAGTGTEPKPKPDPPPAANGKPEVTDKVQAKIAELSGRFQRKEQHG